MTSTLLEREITTVELDTGSPVLAHVINCPDEYERTEDYLMAATVLGFEVTALCGHVFIPMNDHQGKQVCKPCIEEATRIANELLNHV